MNQSLLMSGGQRLSRLLPNPQDIFDIQNAIPLNPSL